MPNSAITANRSLWPGQAPSVGQFCEICSLARSARRDKRRKQLAEKLQLASSAVPPLPHSPSQHVPLHASTLNPLPKTANIFLLCND